MNNECCHQHPDNGDLALQTEEQRAETDLRDVKAQLLKELEQAEHLFGSVRIEIVSEDYDQANSAAARGEFLCCAVIEEARK